MYRSSSAERRPASAGDMASVPRVQPESVSGVTSPYSPLRGSLTVCPAGRDGEQGPAGASAFEAAVDAGYQGTEATFNAALAALPYHGARHLPGGADPISIRTESLENGAVTAEKLAPGAVSIAYAVELDPALWEGNTAPFTQTATVPGLLGSDTPLVDLSLSGTLSTDRKRLEDYAQLYRAATADGALTVYALARPTVTLPLRILCIRK